MKKLIFTMAILIISNGFANDANQKLEKLLSYANATKSLEKSLDYDPFAVEEKKVAVEATSQKTTDIKNVFKSSEKKELKLVSIMNEKAFINGEWYGVGDKIDGLKVVKINKQSVELKNGSRMTSLSLRKSRRLVDIGDVKQ
ncbi:MAG: hypothetical protein PHN38_09160 [Sulfurospirillaceae bacterium]|nr:hypothetical protein [Sulfurospirillaceae bacterium]MDD3463793.1 hypothetical protein [Sulfurospirillaceae bacterium]